MKRMQRPKHPPTATLVERIVISVSCALVLVFLLLEWYWAMGLASLPLLAAAVAQQLRENKARRAAIDHLKQQLPAMAHEERQAAIEHFATRFPSWFSRRELDQFVVELARGEEAR